MVNRLAVKFIAILFVPPQPLLPPRRKRGVQQSPTSAFAGSPLEPVIRPAKGEPVGGDDHFGDELRWRLGRDLNGINAQAGVPMM